MTAAAPASTRCRALLERGNHMKVWANPVVPAKAGTSMAEVKIPAFITMAGQIDDTH